MERIFGRAWLVLGHESQVRGCVGHWTPRRLWVAASAIVSRKNKEEVVVLVNRSARTAPRRRRAEGRGNTERFVCPYHGWSYDTGGTA